MSNLYNSLLAAVTTLAFDGPDATAVGVCFNLDMRCNYITGRKPESMTESTKLCGYDAVSHYSISWPLYSGRWAQPIPYSFDYTGKWEGEQLDYRMSLVNHIKDMMVLESGIY